jgi:ABC-2 type transport system permease protein
MTRAFRAEILKLRRRSILVSGGGAAIIYAAITTVVTFLTATRAPRAIGTRGFTATFASLARPEGGTTAFLDGIGFLGVILLAVFITSVGFEYARGTVATALMKQPRRLQLLAGKMAALLAFLAVALVVAEAAGWLFSVGLASIRGISTSTWFSSSALGEVAAAYGTAFLVAGAWACIGMALATITRSVPIALAIGIAWAGPLEHLIQRSWTEAARWFPGLLLEAVAAGGNAQTSFTRAFVLVAAFIAAVTAGAMLTFNRRDITA